MGPIKINLPEELQRKIQETGMDQEALIIKAVREHLEKLRDHPDKKRVDIKNRGTHNIDWSKFKGAMSKQSISEIDKQLEALRGEWG